MKLYLMHAATIIMAIALSALPAWSVPVTVIEKPEDALQVHLELSSGDIHEGDFFDLHVTAVAEMNENFDEFGSEIYAFGFEYIPSNQIRIVASTVATNFLDDSVMYGNKITAGSAFPGIPFGEISLMSLTFQALGSGPSNVKISSEWDELNGGIHISLYDTETGMFKYENFKCNGEISFDIQKKTAPVPEPTTLLLVGVGMAGLVSFRKKSSKNT